MTDTEASNPAEWVDRYADSLYRFARARVEDADLAQDLVQETFLAALQARERFNGASSERTWLVGILKHKVVDHYRTKNRLSLRGDVEQIEYGPEDDGAFDRDGLWRSEQTAPREWAGDPSVLLEQKEFWRVLDDALSELPPRMARAFRLREVDGLDTSEICRILNVSPQNLFVILHRARKQLRNRLDLRFGGTIGSAYAPVLGEASAG